MGLLSQDLSAKQMTKQIVRVKLQIASFNDVSFLQRRCHKRTRLIFLLPDLYSKILGTPMLIDISFICYQQLQGGRKSPFFFEGMTVLGNGASNMSVRPLLRTTSVKTLFLWAISHSDMLLTARVKCEFAWIFHRRVQADNAPAHDSEKYRSHQEEI